MPSNIIEQEHLDPPIIVDNETGKQVDPNLLRMSAEQQSDGVCIPGIGFVGGHKKENNTVPPENQINKGNFDAGKRISINKKVEKEITLRNGNAYSEIILTSDAYHIYIDLPGVKKDDVVLKFIDGSLHVSGKRDSMITKWKSELKGKNKNSMSSHVSTIPKYLMNKFNFSYSFKKMIDPDKITADFSDGILHVSLSLLNRDGAIPIAII